MEDVTRSGELDFAFILVKISVSLECLIKF